MPHFAKMAKTRFEFEFKFKFGFKPERIKKEKEKGLAWPLGPVSALGAHLHLHGPANRAHLTAQEKPEEEKRSWPAN